MTYKVYLLKQCGTCKKAIRFLEDHQIHYQALAIRQTPPSVEELCVAYQAYEGQLKKIINTSSLDYRSSSLKETIETMKKKDLITLLRTNGNLIKRPFVIGKKGVLVGFKEEIWRDFFLKKIKKPISLLIRRIGR